MRRTLALAVLVVLIAAPVTAAPAAGIDQAGPTVIGRVLEVVADWVAILGDDPSAKTEPNNAGDRDNDPPLDRLGADPDPTG